MPKKSSKAQTKPKKLRVRVFTSDGEAQEPIEISPGTLKKFEKWVEEEIAPIREIASITHLGVHLLTEDKIIVLSPQLKKKPIGQLALKRDIQIHLKSESQMKALEVQENRSMEEEETPLAPQSDPAKNFFEALFVRFLNLT